MESKGEQLNAWLRRRRAEAQDKWRNLPQEIRTQIRAGRLRALHLPDSLHFQDGMPGDWSEISLSKQRQPDF